MATLEIKKAKFLTPLGKWLIFEIEDILIINGKIYFVPKNKKHQYHKLTTDNCIVIK